MNYIKTKQELKGYFNKEYYNSINYSDYQSRAEKYIQTANDIIKYFNIDGDDELLDYGCAIGLLLNGYNNNAFNKIHGFDISEWALSKIVLPYLDVSSNLSIISEKKYYLTTVLDVFEHMFDDDIDFVLIELNTQLLLVRIPVKLEGEDDFHLEVSRKDISHVNCKTKQEWITKIESFGYKYEEDLDTISIYDAPGCFCGYFNRI